MPQVSDGVITVDVGIAVGVSVGKGVGFSNVGTNIVGISVFIVGALLVGVDVVVTVDDGIAVGELVEVGLEVYK